MPANGETLPADAAGKVRNIPNKLTVEQAALIKEQFDALGLEKYKEWVHFALTSQDINNTSIPLLLKDFVERAYVPSIRGIIKSLEQKLPEWDVSMLARTHGQPASPTNLAKEFKVFIERMEGQLTLLEQVPHSCKFGGATGNMNAQQYTTQIE